MHCPISAQIELVIAKHVRDCCYSFDGQNLCPTTIKDALNIRSLNQRSDPAMQLQWSLRSNRATSRHVLHVVVCYVRTQVSRGQETLWSILKVIL